MAKYADTKRCFIAVPVLSPAAISELNGLAALGDFRTEPAYHVTLRFLGDVLPVTAETLGCWIRDERSKDKYPSLRLGLGSSLAVVFPDSSALWVHVTGADVVLLKELWADMETLARGVGPPPAGLDFHPHVTIGRFRSPPLRNPMTAR